MIEIQTNIRNLKCHVKLKLTVLQQEIDNLEEDVNLYADKMIEWERKVKINEYQSISQYKQNATFIRHRVKVCTQNKDILWLCKYIIFIPNRFLDCKHNDVIQHSRKSASSP